MSAEPDQRVATLEEFAADAREFTRILTEMMRGQSEGMGELRAEAANADARSAALAGAQIRTEDALPRLTAAPERHAADGRGG